MEDLEQNKLSPDQQSEIKSVIPGDSNASDGTQPKTKVTKSMEDILKELVEKGKMAEEREMVIGIPAADVDYDYSNNAAVENFQTPTDSLKIFASFLHWYDAEIYEYVGENYNTPLPDIYMLGKLCENDKFQPGFTKQAFDILKKKNTESGKRLKCTLVYRSRWSSVHYCNAAIDVGGGSLENDYAWEIEGRSPLIIMLVGLDDAWKIPVGYLMPDEPGCENAVANIMKMLSQRCQEIGVDIVSVNDRDIASILGCKVEDENTKAEKAMAALFKVLFKSNSRREPGRFENIYKKAFKDLAKKIKINKKASPKGKRAVDKPSAGPVTGNKRRKTTKESSR